ncbi:MAG: uracil-DNA glycosylase [Candidatus Aenigmarchaeota archaeon]|nr:uracil-DNA glycosylase [Candidatus Aenigmarchaeota archaeon]
MIEKEVSVCERCGLWKTRKNPVPGEGSLNPKIMFIGEAPGFNEDVQGRPFVGKAGKFLDELLESVDLKREDVFIGNILKCHPISSPFLKYDICVSCKNCERCHQNIFKEL